MTGVQTCALPICLGGYMAASAEVISYVKHTSRPFIFSASIPPANAASALCALNILKKEPQRVRQLNEIADYMRGLLRERNIPLKETQTPIIPIMTYDDTRTFVLCRELLNEGVYVNPVISPAVPQGYSMIRTSYTATHTRELMDEAADIFAKVFSRF